MRRSLSTCSVAMGSGGPLEPRGQSRGPTPIPGVGLGAGSPDRIRPPLCGGRRGPLRDSSDRASRPSTCIDRSVPRSSSSHAAGLRPRDRVLALHRLGGDRERPRRDLSEPEGRVRRRTRAGDRDGAVGSSALDVTNAWRERIAWTRRLEGCFEAGSATTVRRERRQGLDALLAPVIPGPFPADANLGRPETLPNGGAAMRFTGPFNMSGSPSLAMCGGFDDEGAPIGFQLVGRSSRNRSSSRSARPTRTRRIFTRSIRGSSRKRRCVGRDG